MNRQNPGDHDGVYSFSQLQSIPEDAEMLADAGDGLMESPSTLLLPEPEDEDELHRTETDCQLQKRVSLLGAISFIVGTIIGSGIFASPRPVVKKAGSVGASLFIWSFSGFIAACGALCYAELGTTFPVSGGERTYFREAFGPLSAFLYSWVTVFILRPATLSAITLACGRYLTEPFLPTAGTECSEHQHEHIAKLFAFVAIGMLSLYYYLLNFTHIQQTKKPPMAIFIWCARELES